MKELGPQEADDENAEPSGRPPRPAIPVINSFLDASAWYFGGGGGVATMGHGLLNRLMAEPRMILAMQRLRAGETTSTGNIGFLTSIYWVGSISASYSSSCTSEGNCSTSFMFYDRFEEVLGDGNGEAPFGNPFWYFGFINVRH